MTKPAFFIFFVVLTFPCLAQINNPDKQRTFFVKDTIRIDTLSVIPGSVSVSSNQKELNQSIYKMDYGNALLIFLQLPKADSVNVRFRTFPILLTEKSFRKNPSLILPEVIDNSEFIYRPTPEENRLFQWEGIEKNGSISRSIGFGNNQDLSVNSNLVLQLAGKLNDEIEISAAISDDNLPIQPNGNTQQINDFDKVYIQLKRKGATIVAGDYELRKPESYFMNYFKRTQGLFLSNTSTNDKGVKYTTQVAGAVAKGRSTRNLFDGTEGNQGPYRLTGNNGEQYIIILSGTERVYLDGQLLLRGQENDYVVDYNTAELTFTTKRIITRNSRIVVEFEYSDKIFGRNLYYLNQGFRSKKLHVEFNMYSEQDNPNRPFLQDLNEEQKDFLKELGNQTDQAFYPSVDSVAFNENEILYKKLDTLGFQDIYVYSINPQQAKYRVSFSYVGANNGNYKIDAASPANGRVYVFIPPVNNIPQGDYAPVRLLITPKKRQLITLNSEYQVSKSTRIFSELAFSNQDLNLYSDLENNQNHGFGYKFKADNQVLLSGADTSGLRLKTAVSYEFVNQNFQPLERYRPVEFDRDFNFRGLTLQQSNEHWSSFSLQLIKAPLKQFSYQISSFYRPADYNGLQQNVLANYLLKGFLLQYSGSLLRSKADSLNGHFLKQQATFSKLLKRTEIGASFQQELNQTKIEPDKILNLQSFEFRQYEYFIRSRNQENIDFKLSYATRFDDTPIEQNLIPFSKSKTFNGSLSLSKNKNSPISISTTYRELHYFQSDSLKQDEETLIGRIEHQLNLWKGFLNVQSFYELGTGQEPKREFIYLEVQAGQGLYTWNDYNNNGIKELNEFEVSVFKDQAKFIRIYRPNNEFIRSNFTNINQTFRLNPSALFKGKNGVGRFLSAFSAMSALRIEKKILADEGSLILNPYKTSFKESSLVSLTSFFRNTLYYNRNNPIWGVDLNYQKSENKAQLTNGFEHRQQTESSLRVRWNFIRKSNFELELKQGDKAYVLENFTEKNYLISFYAISPELGYQFSADMKVSLLSEYKKSKNEDLYGGETASFIKFGSEIRYNILKKGTLVAQLNFLKNSYSGASNTSLAYELLEGLQPGNNATWSTSFQRTISNGIQLNFTYEGRKSENIKAVHTGGIQVRAFF